MDAQLSTPDFHPTLLDAAQRTRLLKRRYPERISGELTNPAREGCYVPLLDAALLRQQAASVPVALALIEWGAGQPAMGRPWCKQLP